MSDQASLRFCRNRILRCRMVPIIGVNEFRRVLASRRVPHVGIKPAEVFGTGVCQNCGWKAIELAGPMSTSGNHQFC